MNDPLQVTKYMGTAGFEAYLQSTPKLVPFTGGDDMVTVKEVIEEVRVRPWQFRDTSGPCNMTGCYKVSKLGFG